MSIFTSRKFRFDLLVIFISIFLVSILGITYYFYSRSNEAVLKVANGFIERTNDSIAQKLDNFLQPTPLFSIASLIMNDANLDMHDMESLASYMHVVLESYPQLINAYLADTNGNMFIETHVTRKPLVRQLIPFVKNVNIPPKTTYISAIMTPDHGSESVKFIFKNQLGTVIQRSSTTHTSFDPRERPWYLHAINNGKLIWIGIYPFYQMPDQVITIAFPVYLHNHLMGVAAADLNLNSVRRAIDQFSSDANGIVFVANHAGKVISSERFTAEDEKGGILSTIEANKSDVIKKAYQIFITKGVSHFTFSIDNVKYIAQFKAYSISGNENWEIATVIPIDLFVGSIDRANRNALIFSLITLLIGLILVVIYSNRISRPISQIAAETQDMQHFDFSQSTRIDSHIYEVQTMVNALNIAKSALYSFSKYVPKLLVEQLLRMGNIAAPGGEKKMITVLFTDIINFTHITEYSDPNILMVQLSDYLDAMTKCIHLHHGNIDKYIGDGIMAFWGAPLDDVNQVTNACRAVLDCRREVHRLCDEWRMLGRPVFNTRFGLNTGDAVVGNLGSSDRLNYTAIGDTVNLASRLEEVNKIYETEIIVSESVYQACSDQFIFRQLGSIKIAGKAKPIMVYELLRAKHATEINE